MNDQNKYGSFGNWATWLLNLHLQNTKYLYRCIRQCIMDGTFKNKYDLQDYVEEIVDEHINFEYDFMLPKDLIDYSMSEVNWQIIFDGFCDN